MATLQLLVPGPVRRMGSTAAGSPYAQVARLSHPPRLARRKAEGTTGAGAEVAARYICHPRACEAPSCCALIPVTRCESFKERLDDRSIELRASMPPDFRNRFVVR